MNNSVNSLKISSIEQTNESSNLYPKFLTLIFFVEMWERFSYYGMRSLLVLFLTSQLGFTDNKAYGIYSLFAAIGYSLPIVGGLLADKILGYRNMVVIGGIIITIGHFFLAFAISNTVFLYLALALITIGTGFFKGNITNLLGCCYQKNDPNREKGFTLFYVGVNLGSFLSSIICGLIAYKYGWEYGFGIAGVGMSIGLIVFCKLQHILGKNGLSPEPQLMKKKIFLGMNIFNIIVVGTILSTVVVAKMLASAEFFANALAAVGIVFFAIFSYVVAKSPANERTNLIALSILIFFFMCFFGLEMQLGSLINLFTARNVDSQIFGMTAPASLSQSINPATIIIVGYIAGNYMKFDKKRSTLMMAFGLATLVICFAILYIGCLNADSCGKVAYSYLFIALCIMSIGELCIAPLVMSQVTLLSPKHLRGFIMGIYLLSAAFSNLAGIVLSKFISVPSVEGKVDAFESLAIYKTGFLNITLFNCIVVGVFLVCSLFLHKVLTRQDPFQQ